MTPVTVPPRSPGSRRRVPPRTRRSSLSAPARLGVHDLLARRSDLRQDDLRLAVLPLGDQEGLARRAVRVPAQRAEDRPHRVSVQVVADRVLVDLADLPDRRLEHLCGRERVRRVLRRELPAELALYAFRKSGFSGNFAPVDDGLQLTV